MDLIAEMLLLGNGYGWADLPEIEGNQYGSETESLFRGNIKNGLEPARKDLLNDCAADWKFATNLDELKYALRKAGIKPEDVVDPWGAQYRYSFGLDDRNRTITIASAGPDKKFGTPDDIEALTLAWPYFKPIGNKIDRAVKDRGDPFACRRLLSIGSSVHADMLCFTVNSCGFGFRRSYLREW